MRFDVSDGAGLGPHDHRKGMGAGCGVADAFEVELRLVVQSGRPRRAATAAVDQFEVRAFEAAVVAAGWVSVRTCISNSSRVTVLR